MVKVRLLKLLEGSGKYIVQNVVWQWIALLFQICAIFSIAEFAKELFLGELNREGVTATICMALVAVVARLVCERQATKVSYLASKDVKVVLRKKLYEKILRLGASYTERVATSEVVQMATEGVEQLEVYYGRYLPQLFYSLLAPITLFVVLSPISLRACIVVLICVPLIPASIVAVQKIAKKLLNKYWGAYTELGDSFLENLQGLTTLKIYGADAKKAEEMDAESEHFRKITMKVLTMQLNSVSVMDIVAYGGAAIGMVVTVGQYQTGNISLAGAITIVLLASEFFIPLRLLGSYFHIAMNGMAASDKIFAILDLEEQATGSEMLEAEDIEVELKDVRFGYQKNDMEKGDAKDDECSEDLVIKGISMSIPKGKFVSLVGVSGCGKSTTAALISGRNKGFSGEITINGLSVNKINESSLMNAITTVSHDSYIFAGTVRDNLQMGKKDAAEADMEKVLRQVNLYEFINTRNGLDTVIEERGNNLSGGQRQRLAIARALLHDTPMYIFDESASNIDVESEQQIMKVIHELAGKKTILLISHRMANVVNSDYIYMMEKGEIKEEGTHQELMRAKGKYSQLYEQQQRLSQIKDSREVAR